MQQYVMYECESCGKKSRDIRKVIECEASHLGLSLSEMQEWENLKENVKHKGMVVGQTKNRHTDKDFDEAVEKLLKFEKKHNLCQ